MNLELQALARVVKMFRGRIGEDTIGILMYTGCFHDMTDQELVDLSHRIDETIAQQSNLT